QRAAEREARDFHRLGPGLAQPGGVELPAVNVHRAARGAQAPRVLDDRRRRAAEARGFAADDGDPLVLQGIHRSYQRTKLYSAHNRGAWSAKPARCSRKSWRQNGRLSQWSRKMRPFSKALSTGPP